METTTLRPYLVIGGARPTGVPRSSFFMQDFSEHLGSPGRRFADYARRTSAMGIWSAVSATNDGGAR